MKQQLSKDVFEAGSDPIEVTSNHRPDTAWALVDMNGHLHCWNVDGHIAGAYNPLNKYSTPTLVWVKDGEEYYEGDDEPHDVGHLECNICGEHVEPGYTADTNRVYVPGLRWCRINGESVTEEEFRRRLAEMQSNERG